MCAKKAKIEPIRPQYEEYGAEGYYRQFGADYRNPHEPVIRELLQLVVPRWQLDLGNVLDLACGSGEVTLVLRELGCRQISGIDPFTQAAYLARTGTAAESLTFADLAAGALADRRYGLCVCSFALHLPPSSTLPLLAYQLSIITPALVILTPHKRPRIKSEWGWNFVDEVAQDRVRARLYRTLSPFAPRP
jgi:SAM-dependent methyltransferase